MGRGRNSGRGGRSSNSGGRGNGGGGGNKPRAKKLQNYRNINEIQFMISTNSKGSDVEAKMKWFLELAKADKEFGLYRNKMVLALEPRGPMPSEV